MKDKMALTDEIDQNLGIILPSLIYMKKRDLKKLAQIQISVTKQDIAEVLADYTDEAITDALLSKFVDYLKIDVTQWLRDNAKSFGAS